MDIEPGRRVLVLVGTRPEAIKLAPVVRELRRRGGEFECLVVTTGQHRDLVEGVLSDFEIDVDARLETMEHGQSLGRLAGRLFGEIDALLARVQPDWVLVQGDTSSAMIGALAGFYQQARVGHVEAGLRTHDRRSPFPEEVHRGVIGKVADLHFAPTELAAENLRAEGVAEGAILVTGNTVVDAVLWACERLGENPPPGIQAEFSRRVEGRRVVLVTSHRRETFGRGLEGICRALREIARRHPEVEIVYPVHPNPRVSGPVRELLGGVPGIALVDPLPYLGMVWMMRRSYCILTDSGGIQEEAPTLGKPVLVLRRVTERSEGVRAGCARVVGLTVDAIVAGVEELLRTEASYRSMVEVRNPFGDGRASERIVDALRT